MVIADGLILVAIAASCVVSVIRGFTREAISLAAWVAAFIIARIFSPSLALLLKDVVDTPSVRLSVAFAALFAATLIVGALIARLAREFIRVTGLSGTDRIFGVAFGLVRGLVLVMAFLAITWKFFHQDSWWQESFLIPHFMMVDEWSRKVAQDIIDTLLTVSS